MFVFGKIGVPLFSCNTGLEVLHFALLRWKFQIFSHQCAMSLKSLKKFDLIFLFDSGLGMNMLK